MAIYPGLSEAATDAILAILTANLSQLNAILAADALTVTPTVTSAQIYLGDGEKIPPYDFWITVKGGSLGSGKEIAAYLDMQDTSAEGGYRNTYYAVISAYLSPDAVFTDDGFQQEASRHRLLSRVCDWVRRDCFNTRNGASGQDGLLITLASHEYSVAPAHDVLKGGIAGDIYRGMVLKGPGERIWVECIQVQFEGVLQ